MGVPTIIGSALGFPANFGQHIQNVWSNNQGDSVTVSPSAGNALVVLVMGLDSYDPFDLLHTGNTNPAYLPDLLSFNANPVVTDASSDVIAVTSVTETTTALTLSQAAVSFVLTSVATQSAGSTTYTGTITGGANNVYAGLSFTITGFTNAPNNGTFVCTASTTTTLVLTSATGVAETHAATAALPSNSIAYIGTITGGTANALLGYMFQVAGFTNPTNNGYFLATATSVTTLVLTATGGVNETHAGTATDNVVSLTTAANNFIVGDIVKLSGFVTQTWLNGQSQAVVTAGSVFTVNDSTKNASSGPTGQAASATRSGNDWVAAGGQVTLSGSDYTVSAGNFAANSVKWSLDGFFPCIYMFYALNVTAGTYKITVNSCYQDGIIRPAQLAAGKPIFDGGIDIHVIELSGIAASAASDGAQGGVSTANPAVAPSMTTTAAGDLILTAGIMKSGNAFSINSAATDTAQGTTGTKMLASGKMVGSQAHWGLQFQLQTTNGAITPGFSNPLGYEMAVKSLALKHN